MQVHPIQPKVHENRVFHLHPHFAPGVRDLDIVSRYRQMQRRARASTSDRRVSSGVAAAPAWCVRSRTYSESR